jgi:hypothetical protein
MMGTKKFRKHLQTRYGQSKNALSYYQQHSKHIFCNLHACGIIEGHQKVRTRFKESIKKYSHPKFIKKIDCL